MHVVKPTLTEKSKQTLELLCEGKTHKEIAHELHTTRKAITRHLEDLRAKYGAKSTYQLIAMFKEGKLAA